MSRAPHGRPLTKRYLRSIEFFSMVVSKKLFAVVFNKTKSARRIVLLCSLWASEGTPQPPDRRVKSYRLTFKPIKGSVSAVWKPPLLYTLHFVAMS